MTPPQASLRIGACDVLLLGTIPGFVPDAARVESAFAQHKPDRVALGVPPEDLDTLAHLATAPEPQALIGPHQPPAPKGKRRMSDPGAGAAGIEAMSAPRAREMATDPGSDHPIAGLDEASVRLLELLGRFGATRLPSPDLEAAYRLAQAAGVPVDPLDLADALHAEWYTRLVGVRHILQAARHQREVLQDEFQGAADAYALAQEWDAAQTRVKPLARIERLREQHMAARLRELAPRCARLLALVPATRLAGVRAALSEPI